MTFTHNHTDTHHHSLARLAGNLIILIAVGLVAGRMALVTRLYEPATFRKAADPGFSPAWPAARPDATPFISSNDRSRWATVRSLVENGTFVVARRDLDLVRATALLPLFQTTWPGALASSGAAHRLRLAADRGFLFEEEGWRTVDRVLDPKTLEYYSSKPPLLPTLVAGLAKPLHLLFGWKPSTHPFEITRFVMLLINLLPWWLYLAVFRDLLERLPGTDASRLILLSMAGLGTLVQPYLIVFNNHTPGTFAVLFATAGMARVWLAQPHHPAGWIWHLVTGLCAGFAVTCELPALSFAALIGLALVIRSPRGALTGYLLGLAVPLMALVALNVISLGQIKPAYAEFGGPWYEYEGSSWYDPGHLKRGIDWARRNLGESLGSYAWHLIIGHHGLFSLTPFFLLALPGAWLGLRHRQQGSGQGLQALLGAMAMVLTIILLAFYLYKSDNYGGNCCSARWLQWLTPLLLLAATPAVTSLMGSRSGRWCIMLLVAISVVSASAASGNPWRRPWLYDLMKWCGWPGYE